MSGAMYIYEEFHSPDKSLGIRLGAKRIDQEIRVEVGVSVETEEKLETFETLARSYGSEIENNDDENSFVSYIECDQQQLVSFLKKLIEDGYLGRKMENPELNAYMLADLQGLERFLKDLFPDITLMKWQRENQHSYRIIDNESKIKKSSETISPRERATNIDQNLINNDASPAILSFVDAYNLKQQKNRGMADDQPSK